MIHCLEEITNKEMTKSSRDYRLFIQFNFISETSINTAAVIVILKNFRKKNYEEDKRNTNNCKLKLLEQ